MDSFKICFISGKLGDVDGVSLEVDKWIEILLFTLTYGLFNNRMVFAYSTPNWSSSPSSIVRK